MDHLDRLESQSIYILREAFDRLDRLDILWSIGKDSNVMVWLARLPRSLREAVGSRPHRRRLSGRKSLKSRSVSDPLPPWRNSAVPFPTAPGTGAGGASAELGGSRRQSAISGQQSAIDGTLSAEC